MSKILLILFLCLNLFSKDFKIASYNVENLFDLIIDGTEYKEYKPNSSSWNKKKFSQKLENISRVISEIDADIIALQEIENLNTLKILQKNFPQYKFISFSKYNKSAVGVGFLSKIEIIDNNNINVLFENNLFRPILETTFKIDNYEFKIFNNHWPSKRFSESFRVKYAKRVFDRIRKLPRDYDYILIGDFNSNYNEFKTIFDEKRLNDTFGITGINQILNTTIDKKFVTLNDINNRDTLLNYNLWLEKVYYDRYSYFFKGNKNTPDNIIIPYALFDNKKISYKLNSFQVFKPKYLINNSKNLNRDYSDHLPIFAEFTTNKKSQDKNIEKEINKISHLYEQIKLLDEIILKDVIVIYKHHNNAIIKQKKDRAIYLYNNAQDLNQGYSYDIKVKEITDFKGLKEIKKFEIIKKNGYEKDYEKLYYSLNDIDIFNHNNQNEVIKNINGYYKNRKLVFEKDGTQKSIKIFFVDKNLIPKNGSFLRVKKAQIGYYNSNIQLMVHKREDVDVN